MARRTVKLWLQQALGIDALYFAMEQQRNEIFTLGQEIRKLKGEVNAALSGIGRIIAKHDALYAQSENPLDNPDRKATSDKLGDEVIKRLKDEDAARRHTLGES